MKHAIAKHNKQVEDNAKLAFEEYLIFVNTCDSNSYLEYHFFFVAHNRLKDELGGYYAEVYATYPDEHIHVESFCSLRNGEVDGSWSHKIGGRLMLRRNKTIDGSGSESDLSDPPSDESGSSSSDES